MIDFKVNREKTIAALLYLIREANDRGTTPSQYDLVKTLFLADRAHLNKHGRPITFDRYVAMVHGPVPSFAYDSLKHSFNWPANGRDGAPWRSVRDGNKNLFTAAAEPDMRKLSGSDRKCLSDALDTILSLTFIQIWRLTHEDRAYLAAWRGDGTAQAFPMDMELLLDEPDEAAVDDLRYLAEMASA